MMSAHHDQPLNFSQGHGNRSHLIASDRANGGVSTYKHNCFNERFA